MNPKIDKQEEIYVSIMASLDKAIEDLNQSDRSPVGTYDYLYNGDAEKWIKFAYGLKGSLYDASDQSFQRISKLT